MPITNAKKCKMFGFFTDITYICKTKTTNFLNQNQLKTKVMKKSIIWSAALLLVGALSFQSCSKEDNSKGVVPPPTYEELFVYDFAAAEAAGENPTNFNGNASKGQGFYGWEKEGKTDSKRSDYKGYEWAEGSVLPAECHVWRRSDRINGNVKNGGLYCPNDREMAIDGVEAGNFVQIFYDATNAAEGSKDIIWAIGDGSSDETLVGATARATATIDGVEAETGVTPIASGAKIMVKSVTPAEKGTGYIVVKVKKNMVITKIAILKEVTK